MNLCARLWLVVCLSTVFTACDKKSISSEGEVCREKIELFDKSIQRDKYKFRKKAEAVCGQISMVSNSIERLYDYNEVDISEQNLREKYPEVLHALLKDHSRTDFEVKKAEKEGRKPGRDQWNIIWGTDDYNPKNDDEQRNDEKNGVDGWGARDEITEEKITGKFRLLVRPRAVKEKDIQRQRSKDMAEVFTPSWVCNAQNNLVDEAWFGRKDVFNREFVDSEGVHRWEPTEGNIVFDEQPSRPKFQGRFASLTRRKSPLELRIRGDSGLALAKTN